MAKSSAKGQLVCLKELAAKAVRMLWRELVKEIVDSVDINIDSVDTMLDTTLGN